MFKPQNALSTTVSVKVLCSRVTGNLGTGTHFSGKRVNQDLRRVYRLRFRCQLAAELGETDPRCSSAAIALEALDVFLKERVLRMAKVHLVESP